MSISIAIDGPSGAGKSTLAKRLAAELGFIYVDTGAMYRSIGLFVMQNGRDPHDAAAVEALLPQIQLEAKPLPGGQRMLLNGQDVTEEVRREEVGMAASAVSSQPVVRAFLLDMQRRMAASQNVLMDGRDIGTGVLPDATVKVFLTAAPEARALRRMKELEEKGQGRPFEEVLADVKLRDEQDSTRATAPLKQADDAILLDTTELDFEQSYEHLRDIVVRKAGL